MQLGICVPLRCYATAEFIETLGRRTEELGFDSLWVGEHVVMFDDHKSDYPLTGTVMPGNPDDNVEIDLFTSLAYLAAVTSRIRLGSYVAILPQRNPLYTAKEAANVDWLSNGRLELGVGIGWSVQEYEACAAPFERRGARCRSYVEVIKSLWCDEVSQYEDEFYKLNSCRMAPKPIQKPHPPIIHAGQSEPTLERAVEQGQGWDCIGQTPDRLAEQIGTLEKVLARHGRSRDDFSIRACPYPNEYDRDTIRQYADLGVDRTILLHTPRSPSSCSIDELEGMLSGLAAEYVDFVASL
jgi:probable F420-dependent oxidoreductase